MIFRPNNLTDRFTVHPAYLPVYERLFEPIRDSRHPVLEIGTAGGGGMLMFRDYFTHSEIIGIDNNPISETIIDRRRLTHHQRDAYTPDTVQLMEGRQPFALIVEDGMHTWQTQEWMLPRFVRMLTDDGLLVIEDIQDYATVARLHASLPKYFFGMGIDLRGINQQPDDILFVAWKQ